MSRSKAPQAGFTLIELLVGLALTGLIMALIGAALPLAMSGGGRARVIADATTQLRAAQGLLRRQIGEMPPLMTLDGRRQKLLFSGAQGEMIFPAVPPGAAGDGRAKPVTLSVHRSNGADALVYSSGGETRELVQGAVHIGFAYYGAGGWRDSWNDPQRLPLLVRIQVRPQPGADAWPEMLIAPLTQPPPR